MKNSGVYFIRNCVTKTIYVGHSSDIRERFNSHKSMLRRGKHNNPHLQNSWNKYGQESFVFRQIVVAYNITLRNEIEKYIIKKFKLKGKKLYNFGDGGDAQKHTEESKEKARVSHKALVASGVHGCARYITYNNQTLTVTAWAKIVGVCNQVLSYRLKNWSLESAMNTPPNKKFGPKNKIISSENNKNFYKKQQEIELRRKLWKGVRPHVRLITFNNETLSIVDWSRKLGINQVTLRHRISNWGVEKALTTPLDKLRAERRKKKC